MSSSIDARLALTGELDWGFHTADTRDFTHSIHRYSGKFIPQIARQAIDMLTEPGDVVYDPYCGSGTTLLEAMLAGRRSIGVDLSPLATLISTVKVTPIESQELERLWQAAISANLGSENEARLDVWGSQGNSVARAEDSAPDPRLTDPWFLKWFPHGVIESLVSIDRFADSLGDERLANIVRLVMSDILRRVSRAHQGFPNVMFDRRRQDFPVSVSDEFVSRLRDVVGAIRALDRAVSELPDVLAPVVINGRAEDANVPDGSVDAVVSHPPYIGSVPYAEYGLLSLKWLGADPSALDKELTGGKRQSPRVVERFREGYAGMLAASTRALRPGGHIFLLTGDPTVRGETVDLAAMTRELAESLGLTLAYTAERKGINRRANKMDHETVSIWAKS